MSVHACVRACVHGLRQPRLSSAPCRRSAHSLTRSPPAHARTQLGLTAAERSKLTQLEMAVEDRLATAVHAAERQAVRQARAERERAEAEAAERNQRALEEARRRLRVSARPSARPPARLRGAH